jgi:ABC-type multidrug transport system permease subunit
MSSVNTFMDRSAAAADNGHPTPGDASGLPSQVLALYRRLARRQISDPTTYVNLAIAGFFLAVYTGAFGASDGIERLIGADFLTFILPVIILNASIAGSIAGQLLVSDLESGYLRRLLTLPVSRTAIVLAPMALGATLVAAQAALVLLLGLALGATSATGIPGLLTVMALALLWGLGFAGYAVASGLLAGNAAAAQTASFIFFPLLFLAPTFLPRDQLAGWLQIAAAANPVTYVLETMRALLITSWDTAQVITGFAVATGFCLLTLGWASTVARRTTARR